MISPLPIFLVNFMIRSDCLSSILIVRTYYCGFNIMKPLPSYWTFDRFIRKLDNEYLQKVMQMVVAQKSTAIGVLQENIEEVLKQENSQTKDVDGKLEDLQKQLLQKANRNEQYDGLVEEIYKLRE